MIEIIVPGDPHYIGTCITDNEARPDLSHAWSRAANHIMRQFDFPFFVRVQANSTCHAMVDAILKLPLRHRRNPVKWGWGKGWPGLC